MEPADHEANTAVNRLLDCIHQDQTMSDPETRELFDLLADPDMQAVLMAHDDIARKSFEPAQYPLEPEPYIPPSQSDPVAAAPEPDEGPVRIVTIRRTQGEPLVSCFVISLSRKKAFCPRLKLELFMVGDAMRQAQSKLRLFLI